MVHHSNAGMSVVTALNFELTSELDSTTPTYTLTCTSTGSPVTTVTWMRDGEVLTESSSYSITSWMLLHPENATYTHTLTVSGRLVGEYECNVSNIRTPSSSRNLTVEGELVYFMRDNFCSIHTSYMNMWGRDQFYWQSWRFCHLIAKIKKCWKCTKCNCFTYTYTWYTHAFYIIFPVSVIKMSES